MACGSLAGGAGEAPAASEGAEAKAPERIAEASPPPYGADAWAQETSAPDGAKPDAGGILDATFDAEPADGAADVGLPGEAAVIADANVDASALRHASALATGVSHACAVLDDGTLACWGSNEFGQLGNGSYDDKYTSPVLVPGLSGVTAVAAGADFTCAISSGAVQCWGYNWRAPVLSGNPAQGIAPASVSGVGGAVGIAAGLTSACVVVAGGATCWGALAGSAAPVAIAGLTGVVNVAVGAAHGCALVTGGAVKCWGNNDYGQLGNDSGSASPVTAIASGATAIACGRRHGCALLTGGNVKCWGANDHGELGNGSPSGTNPSEGAPVDVTAVSGVSALAAGWDHTCAVANGAVNCWGNNDHGQLGRSLQPAGTSWSAYAGAVASTVGAAQVGAGLGFSCSRTGSGALSCWGRNAAGNLGNGSTAGTSTPVAVVGF